MTGNRDLARLAAQTASEHTPGSLPRKAWGCAAVALGTTRTVPAARRVITEWDGPPEVKQAALELLSQLAAAEGR